MAQAKINIAIITNIITTYREGFYDRLFKREDLNVTVYCQDYMPGMNLISIHEKYGSHIKLVKFYSADCEKICWQFLPWQKIITEYDVIFIGGNPRVLSDLFLSTLLHFSRKNIVHWTMAHSFRANPITEMIRLKWSKIFKFILTYTDSEVEFLQKKGFRKNLMIGMNNGLDQKKIDETILNWPEDRLKEWRKCNGVENRTLILSCARLESKNLFEQVVQALPAIIAKIPDVLWCLIGSGPQQVFLTELIKKHDIEKNVCFVGALYDEDMLGPWFLSSAVFVHPAAIGLGILHAFGYGLPVVTHGNAEFHGPEYAAFQPELTGRNFDIGDSKSLADTVVKLIHDQDDLKRMKTHSIRIAREKYNIDIMVERFVQIANLAVTS